MKELLITLIQVVIIPAIPVLVTYLVKFLKAKAEQTTTKIDNETVRTYLQEATDAVLQAVTYTTQTYVESLKKQGKFDKDAQTQAFNTAKSVALKLLTEEAKQMITDLYGDLTVWLDTKIEQTVNEQKTFTLTGLQPSRAIES
ncbi:MAG TPA: hypothetical protein DEP23_02425 [Ruminococcaceae bacterium]|nr:hypothetical protein [Oscillospiraceae bacterium]